MENSEKTTPEKIQGWVVMNAETVKGLAERLIPSPGRMVVHHRLIDFMMEYGSSLCLSDTVFLRVEVEGEATEGGPGWCVSSRLKVIEGYTGAELQCALFAASVEIGQEMLGLIPGQLEEALRIAARDVLNIFSGLLKLPTRSDDPGYEELRAAHTKLQELTRHIDPDHRRAINTSCFMPQYGISYGVQGYIAVVVQLLSRDRSVAQATAEARRPLHTFNQILESRVKAIDNGLSRPTEPWYLVDEPLAPEEDGRSMLDLGALPSPPRHLSETEREILHEDRQLYHVSDTEIIYTFRRQGIEFTDHRQLLPWAAIEERKPRYEMQHSFFLTEADVEDIWKQAQSVLARFVERRGYAKNQKSFAERSSGDDRSALVAEALEVIRAASREPLTEQETLVWFLCKRTILSLRDLDPQLREERLDLLQQIAVLVANQ